MIKWSWTEKKEEKIKKESAKQKATELLTQYIKTLYLANGLKWTSENDAEMVVLVEALIASGKVVHNIQTVTGGLHIGE